MWAAMATTPNNIVINPATQYNMVTIVYKLDHGEFSKSYNLGENSNDLANTINVIEEAFKLIYFIDNQNIMFGQEPCPLGPYGRLRGSQ